MNMEFFRKLPIPKEIKEMYPLSPEGARIRAERDRELKAILSGESDKLLVIIGPCSADSEAPVLEYMERLKILSEKVKDRLFIVPRLYTSKPRTFSDGYQGMLHQPDPSETPDLLKGLIATRQLHMRVINEVGFSCADEMLYPENHRYFSDVLAYAAVGARSVEDQQHRLTASGLDIPVGMKNPTSGDIAVLLNSVAAAQRPHSFIYRGWDVKSKGNPYAHAVLRGGTGGPNCRYDDLCRICDEYLSRGLSNPALIIDTNHANSGKQYQLQSEIALDVMRSRGKNPEIKRLVKGFMIESYLEDGAQSVGGGKFGQSITDPCIGWEKTERLLLTFS